MNYQKKLDELLESFNSNLLTLSQLKSRPTLLLHACCGPCSSYVLEYLSQYFDITIFYYNPNIYPQEEYTRRRQELLDFYKKYPPALQNKIKVVQAEYNPEDFYNAIGIRQEPELAHEQEKGERCRRCYEFRLRKTFEYAKQNGFDYFCTTLSISPFKDVQKINKIGESLTQENSIPLWLPSDFKKNNGFKRSLELSQEYNLYRQQYCGCIYSLNNSSNNDSHTSVE